MAAIDEDLQELEIKLQRLKIEYEQYFRGVLKREPRLLRGDVQRIIQTYINQPPTNVRHRFKFNGLCSRFQAYRQLWERTLREIEEGTYQGHLFRSRLNEHESGTAKAQPAPVPRKGRRRDGPNVDKLYEALTEARRRTGEGTGKLTREKLDRTVSRQMDEIRRKHPTAKVRFSVVIEGSRARLRAKVIKS